MLLGIYTTCRRNKLDGSPKSLLVTRTLIDPFLFKYLAKPPPIPLSFSSIHLFLLPSTPSPRVCPALLPRTEASFQSPAVRLRCRKIGNRSWEQRIRSSRSSPTTSLSFTLPRAVCRLSSTCAPAQCPCVATTPCTAPPLRVTKRRSACRYCRTVSNLPHKYTTSAAPRITEHPFNGVGG